MTNRSVAKHWVGVGFFIGIFGTLLIAGRSKFLADPDTFWHIVVGRQILDSQTFMRTDPFSFTFAGEPWIAHQWIGECGMALVERFAGFDGLVIVASGLLAALYSWVGVRLVRTGLHGLVAVLVVSLAMTASSYSYLARPHLSTIVLLGVTFGLLSALEQGKISTRCMWWLLPLCIVWSNLHGGVLGGIASLGFAVCGWTAMWAVGRPSPVRKIQDVVSLLLLIGACSLGTLANPYGLDTPRTWQRIMQSDLPDLIIEHAPLDPHSPEGIVVLGFGFFYLLFLFGVPGQKLRITHLLPLIWLYLACSRIRHGPLFAITAALALADVLPRSRVTALLEKRHFYDGSKSVASVPSSRALRSFGICGVIVGVMLGGAASKHSGLLGTINWSWSHPDPPIWPHEVLPHLRAIEVETGDRVRIFNEQIFGGFLIYNVPHGSVFIDGRCELFGNDFLNAYVAAEQSHETIRGWWEQYDFTFALTRSNSSFDQFFAKSSHWDIVHRTGTATLYRRASVVN